MSAEVSLGHICSLVQNWGREFGPGLVKPLGALQRKALGHGARQTGCANAVVEIVFRTESALEGPVVSHPDLFCQLYHWRTGTVWDSVCLLFLLRSLESELEHVTLV